MEEISLVTPIPDCLITKLIQSQNHPQFSCCPDAAIWSQPLFKDLQILSIMKLEQPGITDAYFTMSLTHWRQCQFDEKASIETMLEQMVTVTSQYGPVTMISLTSAHQVRCIPWVQMGTFNKEIGFLCGLKFFALNIFVGNAYNRVYIWCCKYG